MKYKLLSFYQQQMINNQQNLIHSDPISRVGNNALFVQGSLGV